MRALHKIIQPRQYRYETQTRANVPSGFRNFVQFVINLHFSRTHFEPQKSILRKHYNERTQSKLMFRTCAVLENKTEFIPSLSRWSNYRIIPRHNYTWIKSRETLSVRLANFRMDFVSFKRAGATCGWYIFVDLSLLISRFQFYFTHLYRERAIASVKLIYRGLIVPKLHTLVFRIILDTYYECAFF